MDSDESVHSESELYYPEEETPNETTALKYEEVEQDRQLSKNQDFIHSLRPDNTKKKDNLPFENLTKILFLSWRDKNLGKHSS